MASSSNKITKMEDQRPEDDMELKKERIVSLIFDISIKNSKVFHKLDLSNFGKMFESKYSASICNIFTDAIKSNYPDANFIIGITGSAEDVARMCAINLGFGFTSLKEPGVIKETIADIRAADHNGLEVHYQMRLEAIKLPHTLRRPKVVIIDDLLTNGSRIKAAKKLCTYMGVEVVGAVVLVETQQDGRMNINATPLVSIIDMNELNA